MYGYHQFFERWCQLSRQLSIESEQKTPRTSPDCKEEEHWRLSADQNWRAPRFRECPNPHAYPHHSIRYRRSSEEREGDEGRVRCRRRDGCAWRCTFVEQETEGLFRFLTQDVEFGIQGHASAETEIGCAAEADPDHKEYIIRYECFFI